MGENILVRLKSICKDHKSGQGCDLYESRGDWNQRQKGVIENEEDRHSHIDPGLGMSLVFSILIIFGRFQGAIYGIRFVLIKTTVVELLLVGVKP